MVHTFSSDTQPREQHRHRIKVYNQRRNINVNSYNTNGVVNDGGAAAPLRLNGARDINVLFFFHPIKDVDTSLETRG